MKFTLKHLAAASMVVVSFGAMAQKGETVKIAMIEGLSGPFANVGQNRLRAGSLWPSISAVPKTLPA